MTGLETAKRAVFALFSPIGTEKIFVSLPYSGNRERSFIVAEALGISLPPRFSTARLTVFSEQEQATANSRSGRGPPASRLAICSTLLTFAAGGCAGGGASFRKTSWPRKAHHLKME